MVLSFGKLRRAAITNRPKRTPMSRLKDWGQTIAVIGAMVGTVVACFVFIQTEHTNMRDEHAEIRNAMRDEHVEMRAEHVEIRNAMRDEHVEIRNAMRNEHAEMRAEFAELRAEMRAGFAELRDAMRGEHAETRDRLNSIDRRTARIEGHLFGIEVAPDQEAPE